jgi:hypothetical protein
MTVDQVLRALALEVAVVLEAQADILILRVLVAVLA